ncbi:MAG: hypothetical protein AB7Q29_13145 [Vicinamibacterales bacterium]
MQRHTAKGRGRRRLLFAALFLAEALFAFACLQQRYPISGDDYSYLYQAELFSQGRLYAESPLYDGGHPLHACIALNCLRDDDGRRFSKYAPGWPALLAVGAALGVPWLVGPLLGAALVYLMLLQTERRIGPDLDGAVWALTASCIFLAYYAASYRAHVATALFVFAAYVVYMRMCGDTEVPRGRAIAGLAITGALLGYSALIRYLDWVPLGLWIGLSLLRRRRHLEIVVFVVAFSAIASGNLAYNAMLAGSPFTPPTNVPAGAGLHDQLQLSWDGIRVTAARLGLLLWVFPAVLLLAFRTRQIGASGKTYVLLFAIQVGVYFLYPTAIAGPGPRYLLPYLPFLILAVAELYGRMRAASPAPARRIWQGVLVLQIAGSVVFAGREAHTIYWRRDVDRTLATLADLGARPRIVVLRTGTYRTDRADLVRNPPVLGSNEALIVAGCDDARLDRLREQYPGREVVEYEFPGRLRPVKAAGARRRVEP